MNDDWKTNIDTYRVEQYKGTLESLENLVINLKLESHEYHFDVMTKYIHIISRGLYLRPNDYYQYLFPHPIEVE